MIATDPLSLLFIACFLVGLVFFIVTALMGNLGHGATHGVADHTNIHVGQHSALHPHTAAEAPIPIRMTAQFSARATARPPSA